MKAKIDLNKLRELADKSVAATVVNGVKSDEFIAVAIIELIDRLDEAECAIRDLRMYWIGSYRGGESARRYALNWGLK